MHGVNPYEYIKDLLLRVQTHPAADIDDLLPSNDTYAKRRLSGSTWSKLDGISNDLIGHTRFAQRLLSKSGFKISGMMRKFQVKLADRQCRMSAISSTVQDAVVILVTSLYAANCKDATARAAADTVCRELRRRITGQAPSDQDFRQVTQLGRTIADDGWSQLNGIHPGNILMPYREKS